jgi:cation diffusion facilitator CzcD-associated flavoprotein CzcO
VDSAVPIYQLYDEELWRDFTFTEKYPAGKEIGKYFEYVADKWDLKKDIIFSKHVDGAVFDEERRQWLIETSDGEYVYAKWFIPCMGFAAKRYTPPIKNLGDFKGDIYHTAVWPQHGVNLKGKRIAQLGTGATGIQLCQEVAPKSKHYTLLVRTPNMCLPMRQGKLDPAEEQAKKDDGRYQKDIDDLQKTAAGFPFDAIPKNTFDDSAEDREAFYQKQWDDGGFRFWLANYQDVFTDEKANEEAYKFWRKQVLPRIPNKEKAALLCPEEKPHPFGTKRPSLEQRFYEVISEDHVDLVDLHKTPIVEVTEKGLRTEAGNIDVDVIILATGFDSVTGSLAQLNIKGTNGKTIGEYWANGTRTSIGIAIPHFPNMFFLYGPQAPTAFSNGPSTVHAQANWVNDTIEKCEKQDISVLEATEEEEEQWCKRLSDKWYNSLFPQAKSWYQGSNIPGRKVEPLNWYVTT